MTVIFGFATYVGCGDGIDDDATGGPGPAATNGTGYDPVCNLGLRDGFCNFLGDTPEGCDCLDCSNKAACTQQCNDDGTCGGGEDCTCIDCFQSQVGDEQCPGFGTESITVNTVAETVGSGGSGGTGSGGNGGAASSSAQQSSSSAQQSSSNQASSSATTAAGGG